MALTGPPRGLRPAHQPEAGKVNLWPNQGPGPGPARDKFIGVHVDAVSEVITKLLN